MHALPRVPPGSSRRARSEKKRVFSPRRLRHLYGGPAAVSVSGPTWATLLRPSRASAPARRSPACPRARPAAAEPMFVGFRGRPCPLGSAGLRSFSDFDSDDCLDPIGVLRCRVQRTDAGLQPCKSGL